MYTRSVKVRTKFKVKLYIFDVSFRFETTARRKRVGSKMIIEANFYTFRPSMKFRGGLGRSEISLQIVYDKCNKMAVP